MAVPLEAGVGIRGAKANLGGAMKYLFLRHAETDVSDRREWHGSSDPPLSEKGRVHAITAADRLHDLHHKIMTVICSDFSRAVETASVFGAVFDCVVLSSPLLRERYLGEWEGRTQDEIERLWPGLMEAWRAGRICGPPGGETDDEVTLRVKRALSEYACHGSEPTLVISHAGLLRGLLATHGMPDEEIPPLGGRWLTVKVSTGHIDIGKEASLL
jgi:broad specificity phosphatase PhoE